MAQDLTTPTGIALSLCTDLTTMREYKETPEVVLALARMAETKIKTLKAHLEDVRLAAEAKMTPAKA